MKKSWRLSAYSSIDRRFHRESTVSVLSSVPHCTSHPRLLGNRRRRKTRSVREEARIDDNIISVRRSALLVTISHLLYSTCNLYVRRLARLTLKPERRGPKMKNDPPPRVIHVNPAREASSLCLSRTMHSICTNKAVDSTPGSPLTILLTFSMTFVVVRCDSCCCIIQRVKMRVSPKQVRGIYAREGDQNGHHW